ncbi:MAG TPA: DUF494 family protein [Bacteroidetes bacterium]|nr:DUF494 family protein [Bacteroidota bacterium]
MTMDNESPAPQRVVGLVMHLLREFREQRLHPEEMEEISEDLIGQGYTESEINAAFTWVFSRLDGVEPADILYRADTGADSFRVLHPAERAVLKPEGYGQLLEMHNLGMLDMEDVERVLDRAMSFGGPLGEEDIRMLVHAYLFEENGGRSGGRGAMNMTLPSGTVH